MKISELKKDIKQLSVQDRAALAQWIILNLDDIEEDEHAVDAEWRREVRTRVNDIRDGKVKMIPSEEMWKDLLSRYDKRG